MSQTLTTLWTDLWDRLERAENELEQMAGDATTQEPADVARYKRLTAKRSGVSLALSYMLDMGGRDIGSSLDGV